jgi:hypothetical protein
MARFAVGPGGLILTGLNNNWQYFKRLRASLRSMVELKIEVMPIRLATNCGHCSALAPSNHCKVHDIKVNEQYTCDRFSMMPKFDAARHCSNCSRFKTDSCAHPNKAAEGMLCASWAPQA